MKSSISSFFQCFCNFTKWLKIDGSYNPGQNILGHLKKLGTKMHYCKLTHFLPLIKAWECGYKSHFLLPPLPPPQILIVNTAPGDEGRENASFRWAIVLVFQEFWPGLLVGVLHLWHASSLLLGSWSAYYVKCILGIARCWFNWKMENVQLIEWMNNILLY